MNPYIPPLLPNELIKESEFISVLTDAVEKVTKYSVILSRTKSNKNFLLNPIIRKEAEYSTKIEGTQSTVVDMYQYEADKTFNTKPNPSNDLMEIFNYYDAILTATYQMEYYPISTRLIQNIHKTLLSGDVRGRNRSPGEYRKIQNFIASGDDNNIKNAVFIPPPPNEINNLMSNLEKYINKELNDNLHSLTKTAIIHAQFETIHPFLDGNGRIGRVLIPLYLLQEKVMEQPYFFLSKTLEEDKYKYYQLLNNTRRNTTEDWTAWIKFFLEAMIRQSESELVIIDKLEALYNRTITKVKEDKHSFNLEKIIDTIFVNPIFTVKLITEETGLSDATVRNNIKFLVDNQIVYSNNSSRNRQYHFYDLINILR